MMALGLCLSFECLGQSATAQNPAPTSQETAPSSTGAEKASSGKSESADKPESNAESESTHSASGRLGSSIRLAHLMLIFVLACYLIQIFFAISKASREPFGAGAPKILPLTFGDPESLGSTWVSAATIMLFPTLLSWFLGLCHGVPDTQNYWSAITYAGSVALITTLVTVELTLLLDLREEGRQWQAMLVIALGLDILSLFIFAAFIGGFVHDKGFDEADPYAAVFMGVVGIGAFASSFLIILFSKVANSYKEHAQALAARAS
jgi:hypothetical protein